MMMNLSAAGLTMIRGFEGLKLVAYKDPAGIWTIGYGHTPASPGQTITIDQADTYLMEDLSGAEDTVNVTAGNKTDQDQFDALVSLCFNIGEPAFRSSTVLREHLAQNWPAAARAFLMWDMAHVDGKLVVLPGLLNRREKESQLYLSLQDPPL